MVRAKEKEKVKKAAAKAKKASVAGSATDASTVAVTTAGSKKTVRIVEPMTVQKSEAAPAPATAPALAVVPVPGTTPASAPAPRSKGKGKAAKSRKAQIASANDAAAKKVDKTDSCVIYLGHIPGAFQEKEMHSFFRQFGDVVRVKLFRGKNAPHRSKGYGFIEFTSAETARVVAEVMDGYFLDERKLVSNVVPKHNLHDEMFRGMRKAKRGRKDEDEEEEDGGDEDEEEEEEGDEEEGGEDETKGKVKAKKEVKEGSSAPSDKNVADTIRMVTSELRKKQNRLKQLGIDYEFLSSLSVSVAAAKK